MSTAPSLTGTRRKILTAGIFLGLMTYAVGLTVFGPVLGPLARDLAVSEAAAGALVSWMSLGFLAATFTCGPLAERKGLKIPSVLSALFLATGFGLVATASSYSVAAAGMALYGVGGGFIEVASNAAIADLYPDHRANALNVLHVFFGVAALGGPRLSGYLIASGAGWQQAYLLAAALAILPLPFYLALPFPLHETEPRGETNSKPKPARTPLWKSPTFVALILAVFFYVGAELTLNNWAALYLERVRGWETRTAAAAISDFWLAMTVGRIIVSATAHRFAAGRVLFTLAGGGLLCAALFVALSSSRALATVSLLGCGLFYSGVFAMLFAIGTNAFPTRSAAVSSALTASAGISILLLAPSAGLIANWTSLAQALWVLPFYMGLLLACVLAVIRSGRNAPPAVRKV